MSGPGSLRSLKRNSASEAAEKSGVTSRPLTHARKSSISSSDFFGDMLHDNSCKRCLENSMQLGSDRFDFGQSYMVTAKDKSVVSCLNDP
jgi:hypothetical protein